MEVMVDALDDELDDQFADTAPWWADALEGDLIDEATDDLLDQLVALDRQRSRLAALEAELMVRLAGSEARHHQVTVLDPSTDTQRLLDIADEVREEIAAALHRPPAAVHDQVVSARLLLGPLRRTRDALAEGRLTESNARVIAEGAALLLRSLGTDPDALETACTALQDRVLARAERCTRSQLRRVVRAAVAGIDAAGELERRRQARASVDVTMCPDEDGLAVLMACMPAVDAARVLAAVNAVARSEALVTGCDATLGERRAAALLALATGTVPGVEVRAEITVMVGLADLVEGTGAVRTLIDDETVPLSIRRLVTDPLTGRALDLGRRRYEVSEPLRRWIATRDRTCRFPGCSRRATACQVDHVTAWSDEGATDAENLHALCTRHHQLKTHAGWEVRRDDGSGLTVWTSPAGRTYWVDPDPPPEIAAA
jgi:hypothetical protein